MRVRIEDPKTVGLLALCVALVLVILIEWSLPPGHTQGFLAAGISDEQLVMTPISTYRHPPIEHFAAVLDRPLFFQDRKLPPAVVAKPAPPPKPLRLELVGVALVGDTRIALLRSLIDKRLLNLPEGDSHEGWKLESVVPDSVTFSRGGDSSRLYLELDSARSSRR